MDGKVWVLTRATLQWLANHGIEAKYGRSHRAIESSRKPDISEAPIAWKVSRQASPSELCVRQASVKGVSEMQRSPP